MELVIERFMAARPKPMNGHVTYFHYFVSVVVRELFTFKSSFPEPQGTPKPAIFTGTVIWWCLQNVHLVMFARMFTW